VGVCEGLVQRSNSQLASASKHSQLVRVRRKLAGSWLRKASPDRKQPTRPPAPCAFVPFCLSALSRVSVFLCACDCVHVCFFVDCNAAISSSPQRSSEDLPSASTLYSIQCVGLADNYWCTTSTYSSESNVSVRTQTRPPTTAPVSSSELAANDRRMLFVVRLTARSTRHYLPSQSSGLVVHRPCDCRRSLRARQRTLLSLAVLEK
jgi:hypothetical protein